MRIQKLQNESSDVVYNIFLHRGMTREEIKKYLTLSDEDINNPLLLGEQALSNAAAALERAILSDKRILMVVDSDCDGYTSSAILYNYLYRVDSKFYEEHTDFFFHQGKQHGLYDVVRNIPVWDDYSLVICADSASNDYEEHKILKEHGIDVVVLDHHLADHISEDAYIVNNQLSGYPNKDFCGAGVVWQFCRYLDRRWDLNGLSNDFIDLVALGLVGDMMSLRSPETRRIVTKGFSKDNIKNVFLRYMINKNNYSLTKSDYKSAYDTQACTPMGAAFFIVPFVNAVNRSGTQDEKELLFYSMLDSKALVKILSNKRGHKIGEEEFVVEQAVRMTTNVKNRQSRAEEDGLTALTHLVKSNNMLDHKALIFLVDDKLIKPEIRGLVANKMMALYQRPCAILSYDEDNNSYSGSMRGYTKTGVDSFKQVCDNAEGTIYCEGHDNAAGLCVNGNEIEEFQKDIDDQLQSISTTPLYTVDYFFDGVGEIDKNVILTIASMNDMWGQDIDRAYIGIKFKVKAKDFTAMKSNTLSFDLGGVKAIKFGGSDEEVALFSNIKGWIEITAFCKCNANEWQGKVSPQLMIEDYEITDSCDYIF